MIYTVQKSWECLVAGQQVGGQCARPPLCSVGSKGECPDGHGAQVFLIKGRGSKRETTQIKGEERSPLLHRTIYGIGL